MRIAEQQSASLGGTVRHRVLDSTSRISDPGGLQWGPRICISKRFSGDADSVGQGPCFE